MVTVVVFAYHEMGRALLQVLLSEGVDVGAVFTHENDPEEEIWFGSVREVAEQAGIQVHLDADLHDPVWGRRLAELRPNVAFSFHYRRLLPDELLRIPPRGCVNLHPSLLPAFRGQAPINWQLVKGVTESGVTLHYMTRRADAGDIIDQERVEVGPDDTALDLYRRLMPVAADLLRRNLPGILAGTAPRRPQNSALATRFGRRTPEDGRIDWTRPAREIHDLVRAVAPPWPGAFFDLPKGRVRVLRTRLVGGRGIGPKSAPGEVIHTAGRTYAGTGDGLLELVEFSGPAAPEGETPRDVLPQSTGVRESRS